jgi:hypothetical protein
MIKETMSFTIATVGVIFACSLLKPLAASAEAQPDNEYLLLYGSTEQFDLPDAADYEFSRCKSTPVFYPHYHGDNGN